MFQAPAQQRAGCPLCEGAGGTLLWQGLRFRLIRADEAGFPAFYRVVWNDHISEFSDLPSADRVACMAAVAEVEAAVRAHLKPAKVNLAALGNMVPHLHWHVIARWDWDSRWPAPVWASPVRQAPADALAGVQARLLALDAELARRLAAVA